MVEHSSSTETSHHEPGLSRQLGLTTATALVVAEVIGVGIFLTTAGMVKSLGSPFWLLTVWLTTGVAAAGGAICFGALAARRPEAGGAYVYLKEAYGRRVAFLFGWLSMLVTDPGITAAVAVGLAHYVSYLVPLSPWGSRAVAIGSIWLLAAVNIRGVDFGSGVIRGLAGLKLGVLGFLVLWGLGLGRGDWSNFVPLVEQRPGSDPLVGALIGGMIAAFFSLGGWWDVSKVAGEVRDPGRNLPGALLLGVTIVTFVYILISLVFLYLVPPERIDSRETFAALTGEALFGRAGGVVLSLIVVVTVLGSLAALLMAMPRVYFAMAPTACSSPRRPRFIPGTTPLPERSRSRPSWPASWLCSVPSMRFSLTSPCLPWSSWGSLLRPSSCSAGEPETQKSRCRCHGIQSRPCSSWCRPRFYSRSWP